MTERPILFSPPMIRAILTGRKTQTRRLLNPQPEQSIMDQTAFDTLKACAGAGLLPEEAGDEKQIGWAWKGTRIMPWPRGLVAWSRIRIGDHLWVREAWQYADWTEDGYPFIRYRADDSRRLCETIPSEWAGRLSDTWSTLSEPSNFAIDQKAADRKWRPGIFLPRWASRLTLKITEVRAQRLTEISEEDARAEGMIPGDDGWRSDRDGVAEPTARGAFFALWKVLNGEQSFRDNPMVWALSFEVVK